MFRRHLDDIAPDDVLAQTIYTDRGDVLLGAGTPLSAGYVEGLRRRGTVTVYVRDGLADDVVPVDIVRDRVRAAVQSTVATAFTAVAAVAEGSSDGGGDRPTSVDEAIRRLGAGELSLDGGEQVVETLYRDVELLLSEVSDNSAVATLESLKSHNTYTYQHSVDVAIVGVLAGKRAGLPREQLRDLALGALLHDIGKMYVDVAILDKPDKLSAAEFAEIRKHPLMGFELLRRLPVATILPAHVAYQHHERQDGGGYPRGLAGTNRVERGDERFDPRRMLVIAEIAAVADVYSAIASDRPYRTAMAADEIVTVLRRMAGPHLNREIVSLLLELVPPYPVGHWVEVVSGGRTGWRGVVTDVPPRALDRPAVRLLLDARGETVDPEVLDLAGTDVHVRCLAPGQDPAGR